MPSKFTKAIKTHFGITARGRPTNAELQRNFGTTDYKEAGERAAQQYNADFAATLAARRKEAYDRKKQIEEERNQRKRGLTHVSLEVVVNDSRPAAGDNATQTFMTVETLRTANVKKALNELAGRRN